MNDISIVTAFFDIGRGDWTPDKGLPHYLHRTTETYLQRFSHLAKLENDITVFTSEDLAEKVHELRDGRPTNVVVMDFNEILPEVKHRISEAQNNSEFQKRIHPSQIKNPEYWNADYVLVNLLKSSFARQAIQNNLVTNEMVAWLDFGYCRNEFTLNGVQRWQYSFDKDKIHFFTIKDFVDGTFISDVIFNNDVYVTGPCIVASKNRWSDLEMLVNHNVNELLKNNLIDDDQTLLLMSYLSAPELFELHRVSGDDWFVAFKEYHESLPAQHRKPG